MFVCVCEFAGFIPLDFLVPFTPLSSSSSRSCGGWVELLCTVPNKDKPKMARLFSHLTWKYCTTFPIFRIVINESCLCVTHSYLSACVFWGGRFMYSFRVLNLLVLHFLLAMLFKIQPRNSVCLFVFKILRYYIMVHQKCIVRKQIQ